MLTYIKASDENGDIVVTLFNPSSPTAEVSGEFTNGTITASSLEGPLQGKQMSDLIGLINNGQHMSMFTRRKIRQVAQRCNRGRRILSIYISNFLFSIPNFFAVIMQI